MMPKTRMMRMMRIRRMRLSFAYLALAWLIRMMRFVRMMRQRFQGGFDMMHVHIDAGFIDITKLIAVFLLTVHWT